MQAFYNMDCGPIPRAQTYELQPADFDDWRQNPDRFAARVREDNPEVKYIVVDVQVQSVVDGMCVSEHSFVASETGTWQLRMKEASRWLNTGQGRHAHNKTFTSLHSLRAHAIPDLT
jgi:hypothetical protein